MYKYKIHFLLRLKSELPRNIENKNLKLIRQANVNDIPGYVNFHGHCIGLHFKHSTVVLHSRIIFNTTC